MKRLTLTLALVVACGGGSPAEAPAAADAKKPAAPASSEELKDRSVTPLKTVSETIDGVAFTVDAPEGTKRETDAKDKWINWTFTDGNPFKDPSVTVKLMHAVMAPRDLDALVRGSVGMSQDKPPPEVFKKEELPGGAGMIALAGRTDGQYFKLVAIHRKDDKVLQCTVTYRTGTGRPEDKPIPNVDAAKAWAEKLCRSVKFN